MKLGQFVRGTFSKNFERGLGGNLLKNPDCVDMYFSLVLLSAKLMISYIKYFDQ